MRNHDENRSELIKQLVDQLKPLVGDARHGLPQDVFLLISELTPLVNVDLLIHNSAGQTLLTWRADELYGPGWHIPGGIIRFKEKARDRISKVADEELGVSVSCENSPLFVTEIMHPSRGIRGHFISLLYRCSICGYPTEKLRSSDQDPKHGQWAWFSKCPENLIHQHAVYAPFIGIQPETEE